MAADPADHSTLRATRRRRVVLGVVILALLISIGGVIASAHIRSPQQQIADAKGPGATVLTAPVEFRALDSGLTLNGQVGATSSVAFTPTVSDQSDGRGVVTALPKRVGAQIRAGQVVAEIDGRPVIALPGMDPSYRDLRPGSHGQDVAQLQRALLAVGVDSGSVDGVYGARTKEAVASLYDRLGYEPVLAGDEAELRGLTLAVRTAERSFEDARTALAGLAQKSPDRPAAETAVRRAGEDLSTAREDLVQAQAVSGAMLPSAEVVFLPDLPARVTAEKGAVGGKIGQDPLLTMAGGELVVDVEVQEDDLDMVTKKSPVEVAVDADPALTGRVVRVGAVQVSETGQRIEELSRPVDGRVMRRERHLLIRGCRRRVRCGRLVVR